MYVVLLNVKAVKPNNDSNGLEVLVTVFVSTTQHNTILRGVLCRACPLEPLSTNHGPSLLIVLEHIMLLVVEDGMLEGKMQTRHRDANR